MKNSGSKCKHPGLGRQIVSVLAIFGEGFAEQIVEFAIFLQKFGNTIKFEHFWKKEVATKTDVIVLPSFNKTRPKHAIWDIAIQHANSLGDGGRVLEFGTNNGGSLYYFWSHMPDTVELHGFDCFDGIPEAWDSLPKGAIKGYGYPYELWREIPNELKTIEEYVKSTGIIPDVPQSNIKIHKGLFAHTVPELLSGGVPHDIRLIHFDADIYMGTRPVLDSICGQIKYRHYILFDELYSVNHEFRAWLEFVKWFDVKKWRVVAITEDGAQALVEVN